MKIYILVITKKNSSFYFLYIISIPHHFHTMDFTHINYDKKTKISIPFTIIFHETLHSYKNFFSSSENVSKGHKHSFIYQPKEI